MSIHNDTNKGRVQKIIDICDLIAKSANSNNADREDIWELMQPALDRIGELVGAEAEPPQAEPQGAAQEVVEPQQDQQSQQNQNGKWAGENNPPVQAVLRDMASEASLEDLTMVMAVYLNRLDEHFSKD